MGLSGSGFWLCCGEHVFNILDHTSNAGSVSPEHEGCPLLHRVEGTVWAFAGCTPTYPWVISLGSLKLCTLIPTIQKSSRQGFSSHDVYHGMSGFLPST
jgi:hypothetical protein